MKRHAVVLYLATAVLAGKVTARVTQTSKPHNNMTNDAEMALVYKDKWRQTALNL